MIKWKIVNKKKGRKLHLSEIRGTGVLQINLKYIPRGWDLEKFLYFIEEAGIVIREGP